MQIKKLALAVAFAVAAPSAFATLETLPVAVPAANIINMTGATAPTKTVGLALEDICASAVGSTSAPVFIRVTDGTAAPVGKAWKCAVSAGATFSKLPGVTGPWIVRKNEGGSLNGVVPMRNGSTQTQLNTNAAACAFSNPTTATCPIGSGLRSHIGISDVSQNVFSVKGQLPAIIAGNTYVADIAIGQLQGFGVAVSPQLYALLQADQGVGAGIPSISQSVYASLTSSTNDPWPALLPNGTAHPLSNTVNVLRRSTTSGTQAASELFFLKNPCLSGAAPLGGGLSPLAAGSYAGGALNVVQAANSDAVINGVNQNTGYALGVASLENIVPASGWKFVAVDGVHPGQPNAPEWQRKNIVNGSYPFAYATYLFQNTSSNLGAALLGNIGDLKNALVEDLGVGANLNDSNGIAGDPLAPTADFGVETAKYSRQPLSECSQLINQF